MTMASADSYFTQGRIRINEMGARYLAEVLRTDIGSKLLERKAAPSPEERRAMNQEIARARRVLEEVERVIAEVWG
jgi:hypothetical protein